MAKPKPGESPATLIILGAALIALWGVMFLITGGESNSFRGTAMNIIALPGGVIMIIVGIVKRARGRQR